MTLVYVLVTVVFAALSLAQLLVDRLDGWTIDPKGDRNTAIASGIVVLWGLGIIVYELTR